MNTPIAYKYVDQMGNIRLSFVEPNPSVFNNIHPLFLDSGDQWRDAIDNELVTAHLGTYESYSNAKSALSSLIQWHIEVALNPAISKRASDLVQLGEDKHKKGDAAAYRWAYEYLQSRMVSIGRQGWASDCDSEIEARIK